jgi:Zn-dependent metalloprotease
VSTNGAGNKVHYYYEQYYKGINVVNGTYAVHAKEQKINSISGSFHKISLDNIIPSITSAEALVKAKNFVQAKKYEWEVSGPNVEKSIPIPTGILKICKDYSLTNSKYCLAYQFKIVAIEPYSAYLIYIDAINGQVIYFEKLDKETNTSGTSSTLYSGTQSITMDSYSGGYRLQETRNSCTISTLNAGAGTSTYSLADYSNSSTTWPANNGATDIHWGLEKVSDYWVNVQGRNNLDNHNHPITALANYGYNFNNAQWNSTYEVVEFGTGNGSTFNPLTSLDIVGHETGHAISYYSVRNNYPSSAGLYGTQASIIDEGLSDIGGR